MRNSASRIQLTKTIAIAILFGVLTNCCVAGGQETQRRPNIVWMVAENFCLDFGCYGAKNVRTPHVDSLAAGGMRYTNVFSTSPVCAPSRSCFMTGMYATTTDMHHMRSHRDDDFRLPDGVRPVTHRLRDAGYTTGNLKNIDDQVVGTGKLDLNFVNEGELYATDDWSELVARQPFFAQINMPEAEYDIYDRKSAEEDARALGRRGVASPSRYARQRKSAAVLSRSSSGAAGVGSVPE